MKQFLTPALALVLLTCAGCGRENMQSPVEQASIHAARASALSIAGVYRAAKTAGAAEFKNPVSGEQIISSLEQGVQGTGIFSSSVFRVSQVPASERESVVYFLEEILGL